VAARPLRLLLVINRLTPSGGAEVQLAHLSRGLAELGHQVTICCVDDSTADVETLESSGVEIICLQATTPLGRVAAVPRLARLARRADVVHCTMWDASLWGRIAAILARRPVIVADHATDRSSQVAAGGAPRAAWIARHNRLLDRFTFATVACSEAQRPILLGEGVAPGKIVHIPNGVPVGDLSRAGEANLGRRQLGLPEGTPVAMQVAVFRPEKNQLGGLEAMVAVREQIGGVELVFVGNGPTQAAVEARAEELGATAWAHFLGERTDVAALLSLADLMLLPSLADAMPMTVLEAMALGVPLVASDVGDVREVIGDAGVCVAAGDGEAFSAAVVRLLEDDGLRSRMGELGRTRAAEFDSSTMAGRYAALFEAAAAGGEPSPAP
jgi:glycosyltransferase involved in cell wall biosynthesis